MDTLSIVALCLIAGLAGLGIGIVVGVLTQNYKTGKIVQRLEDKVDETII